MNYTIEDIKKTLSGEKLETEIRTNPIGFLTYRQLSFIITPFFLKRDISANAVTFYGLFLCLFMPISAIYGGGIGFLLLSLLDFLFHLFDHLDGNIARITKSNSNMGKYLDSFAGIIHWTLLYISLAILVDLRPQNTVFLSHGAVYLGMATAIFDLAGKRARLYAKYNFKDNSLSIGTWKQTKKGKIISIGINLYLLMPVFIVVSNLFNALDLSLIYLFCNAAGIYLLTEYSLFKKLSTNKIENVERDNKKNTINRYRVSFLSPNQKYLIRKFLLVPFIKIFSKLISAVTILLPMQFLKLDRPIFIIGCSRSGTTLFADMFAKHRDLANWTEAPHVFELDYYNKEIDHVKTENDASPKVIRRIRFLLGFYTKLLKKKRFVNKHPQNSLRIIFLKEIFPDAIFIHILRDGRAVVQSNVMQVKSYWYRQTIPFGSFPKPPDWRKYVHLNLIKQYSHQWVDIIEYIRNKAKKQISEKNYIEIYYEDFCKDPHDILQKVDNFCGLSINSREYKNIPNTFHSSNFRWKDLLSDKEIEEIELIGKELLEKLNYPLNASL